MKVFSYSNKREVLSANGAIGNLLAETRNNDFVELQIPTGGFIPPHALDIDVSFYIITGEGKVSVSDEEYFVKEGDIIHVDKNLNRAWENKNHELLKVLVIKQK